MVLTVYSALEELDMQWYKINISYEESVQGNAGDLVISLIKAHHATSVSLDSLAVYSTGLDSQGKTIYLLCEDKKLVDKLRNLFNVDATQQPELEQLEPVYGYFLGEDVTDILGFVIKGERAPASAPAFAEPYRGGEAGYAVKGTTAGNSAPEQQSAEGEIGKALGAA